MVVGVVWFPKGKETRMKPPTSAKTICQGSKGVRTTRPVRRGITSRMNAMPRVSMPARRSTDNTPIQ